MALTEVDFSKFLVKIDDGAGTFAHYCMINADRGISLTNNTNERLIPDCDTPANPDKTNNRVTSQSIEISGAGVYDQGTGKFFLDWWKSGSKKSVKVEIGEVGGERITGNALLTNLNITGAKDDIIQADMTLMLDTDDYTTATIT